MIMQALKDQLMANVSMLEADIANCPDDVWTKKIGGDSFWQQLAHALISLQMFLVIPGGKKQVPAMKTTIDKDAMSLHGEPKATASKDELLALVQESKTFIESFFSKADESMLSKTVPFFGMEKSLIFMLLLECGHMMYHQGVCDALLRDNGAKAAL